MIRLVLLIIIGFLAYSLFKKAMLDKAKRPPKAPAQAPELPMKKCAHCGLHLPENDALTYQTLHFCNEEHKQLYLEHQNEKH